MRDVSYRFPHEVSDTLVNSGCVPRGAADTHHSPRVPRCPTARRHLDSARPRASSHSSGPPPRAPDERIRAAPQAQWTCLPPPETSASGFTLFPRERASQRRHFPPGESGLFPPSVENLAAPRPAVGDNERDQQERRLPFRGHPGPRPLTSAPQEVGAAPELWAGGQPGLGLLARRPIRSVRAGGLRRDRPRDAG